MGAEEPESREQYDIRIKEATAAHERNEDRIKVHATQIQTFGSDAMKAPALVALGGVVALLGFYSANYDRLKDNPVAMDAFGHMLFWLFASLLMTVAAPGLAYLSQIAYSSSITAEIHTWTFPYTNETPRSRVYKVMGDVCRWTAVGLILCSIAALAVSGFLFFGIVR